MSHPDLLWQRLHAQLESQIAAFPGVAGISVQTLTGDLALHVQGDEIFPTASTIKVHILTRLLARAEAGEIDLQQQIPVDLTQTVLGSGVLAYLDGPVALSLLDLATLMIIVSDNTATNICIDHAGLAETNQLLQELGLRQTQLRRKMMDHLAAVREEENVSTPAELVQIFLHLHQGRPSPWVAQQALAILRKPKHGFLGRALPPGTELANKPGYVEGARCDAGIVTLPRRSYAIAMMSKYAQCNDLAHEQFLITLARTVHQTLAVLDTSNQFGRTVY